MKYPVANVFVLQRILQKKFLVGDENGYERELLKAREEKFQLLIFQKKNEEGVELGWNS